MRKFAKMMMPTGVHSISSKLIASISLAIALIAILLYLTVPQLIRHISINMAKDKAESISSMTAYSIRAALDFNLLSPNEDAFNIAEQNEDLAYLVLKDKHGKIIYSFNKELADEALFQDAIKGNKLNEAKDIYRVYKRVENNNRFIGELYLGLSLEQINSEVYGFQKKIFFGTFFLILFGVFAAVAISRVVTGPLGKIVTTFDHISKGDLTIRADVKSRDEIGQLAESFNLMVESLEFAINELENSNKNLHLEIVERKKAEEELRKLNIAIIQSPVSIMITNANKTVEYINPKFEQVSGFAAKEMIGKPFAFFMEAEKYPENHNNLWNTISKGKEWKGEFQSTKRDGSTYWEYVSISPIYDKDSELAHIIMVKEDITESKKLEENRKKYDFIVNSSKDLMSLVNRNYEYEAVNQAFCDAMNLDRTDVVGNSMSVILDDDELLIEMKKALDAGFEGESQSIKSCLEFPEIGKRFLDIRFYPFYDGETDEASHCSIIAKDITKQHEAELILKESEERYRELVSNLPDLVLVHQHGKVLFANSVIEELLGYNIDDVVGKTVVDFIAPAYRDLVAQNIQRRIQGEDLDSYEVELITKNGEKFYVEIRGAKIAYDHQPAILNVVVNITERKKFENKLKKVNEELELRIAERTSELLKAVEQLSKEIEERKVMEESLRDSEEKFKALAEYSNDVIMRFNNNLDLLYVNEAIERNLGIPRDQLTKEEVSQRFISENELKVEKTIASVFNTAKPERLEIQIQDGSWIDLVVSPEFAKDNSVKTVLASARDITDLKNNEQELILAKEKALESSRLKSEFLANMSHEIRTPMNAILGFTDVLNAYVVEDKQKSYLSAIKTAGKNLLTLINDILDLSKIEAGRLELNYEPVDPKAFINDIKNIFYMRIADKRLDFKIEIDQDLPDNLLLDEVRFRQVLFNLIGNAVKFTDRGYIKLSMKKYYVKNDKSSVDLIVAVEDTGIGIPEESQEIIFESFRQQEGQSTKKFGGTGLGLAITRRLVEMMGGEITVKSKSGEGSTFNLVLHNVAAAAAPAKEKKEVLVDAANIQFSDSLILVVDDVDTNRNLIREYFAQSDVTIIEAENGKIAIDIANAEKPDIILMDIRMPVMSGYEAIKIIKADKRIQEIPVIAITASAMKEDRQKIEDAGFNSYLMKPVQKSELFTELKSYLPYTLPGKTEEILVGEVEEEQEEEVIVLNNIDEFLAQFDVEVKEIWEKAYKTKFINDVSELADVLLGVGKKFGAQPLKDYASSLKSAVNNFDIEKMNSLLIDYNEMTDKIKNSCKDA